MGYRVTASKGWTGLLPVCVWGMQHIITQQIRHDYLVFTLVEPQIFPHQVMMILKSLPSFLLSTSSLLICLTNWCNSAAPTDLPPNCTTVSTNQRALLDSCCYATLLPASDGTASTWSAVDVDGDGMTVSQCIDSPNDALVCITACLPVSGA